ncbi:uncharacterized protein BYT42DRAFT_325549 [Radiomyces spectabilis]|uniref:uncharacterized protein n=1 Tax=Radiomyces spectabilis TaxID=64574 RepID=UPI00221E72DC|nr:uncharacterized protein BYT42DRAFT_325549 [Radiomyces spectabilis]KAI8379399.1 hypothetical protein BYT42DRAFT_325549 [Radiomyces spectabilis]
MPTTLNAYINHNSLSQQDKEKSQLMHDKKANIDIPSRDDAVPSSKYFDLPPTPSSSSFSMMYKDESGYPLNMERTGANCNCSFCALFSVTDPWTLVRSRSYGSIRRSSLSDDVGSAISDQNDQVPSTPPYSTISPNDDDEGLYLLWTHQILREQGYRPASCRPDDDEDDYSMDSSITNQSMDEEERHSTSTTSSRWRDMHRSLRAFLPCFA